VTPPRSASTTRPGCGGSRDDGYPLWVAGCRLPVDLATSYPLPATSRQLPAVSYQPVLQHPALSTQYSVLSTQHPVLSTQYSAPSTRHSALSTQYSVLSTQYSVLLHQSLCVLCTCSESDKALTPSPSPIAADGGERGAGILSCLGVSAVHSHCSESLGVPGVLAVQNPKHSVLSVPALKVTKPSPPAPLPSPQTAGRGEPEYFRAWVCPQVIVRLWLMCCYLQGI
jgi:hypothetical protein